MSNILDQIAKDPTLIFSNDNNQINSDLILKQVKDLIDPITENYSVLDEIHIDGLVPSQVWGQVKLVVDGINQDLLFGRVKELRETLQDVDDEEDEEDEEDDDDEEEEEEEGEGELESESDSDEEYYNAVDDLDEISNEDEEVEDIIKKDKFGLNDKFFSIDKFNKETTNENNIKDEYNTIPPDVNLLSDKLPEDESNVGTKENELYYTDYYKLQKGETIKDIKKQQIKNSEFELVPEKDVFNLNDQFFSIDEFNKQILKMESKGDNFAENDNDDEGDEEIDYFNDLEDDDDDEMLQYDDFFKPQMKPEDIKKLQDEEKIAKTKKKNNEDDDNDEFDEDDYDDAYESVMQDFADEDDFEIDEDEEIDQDDEIDESTLSTFELQQLKIKKEIEKLENEQISEKKWTMKGEVSAKNRKNDSLLIEELQFDRTAKPVPVITQEITESIVDIIRRRIKNEQFDELSKRIISELNNFKNSKKIEVSEEKSKKSLSELYEDEYNSNELNDNTVINEELQKQHDEISELYIQLNHKLDSLCSSHFIPKPKEKLIDIKVQASTILMEDSQPLTLSNSETLAPQEIYKTKSKIDKNEIQLKSGIIISKDELDRSEKQRLRRSKKRKIHNRLKENSEKKKKILTNNINK
ncbi:hypothetical protein B5S29_g2580 [[Candida] boidinii]|nr:hypothetical protein B5S29_g2580 [[Candida] boidinii]